VTRASTLTAHMRTAQHVLWGESVSYVRQSTDTSLSITARKAGVRTAGQSGEDVVVSVELFDWVVTASDLVDEGSSFEPDEGDTIVAVVDGVTTTYHVGTYGGERCWEPADSDKAEFVIHTKLWSET